MKIKKEKHAPPISSLIKFSVVKKEKKSPHFFYFVKELCNEKEIISCFCFCAHLHHDRCCRYVIVCAADSTRVGQYRTGAEKRKEELIYQTANR